jgi:predicted ATP-dependent endonuclease of OLD family
MIFDSIEISNFKGLRRASFTPRNFSCLVGENNAGKSSILQAIVYALNRPQYLPESMFYDAEVPIEFHCCFSIVTEAHLQRLAEEHLRKIQPLVENEVFRVVVRYRLGEKVEIKVVKNVPVEERLRDENINEAFKGKEVQGFALLLKNSTLNGLKTSQEEST